MEFHILIYPSPGGGFWVFNGFKAISPRSIRVDWQLWDKDNTQPKQIVMLQNAKQVAEAKEDIYITDGINVANALIIKTIRIDV